MIMGAGAPLDLTLPTGLIWPSTINITAEVRKPYDMILTQGKTTDMVERIYQHLMKVFPVNQNIFWNLTSSQIYILRFCFMCWNSLEHMIGYGMGNVRIHTCIPISLRSPVVILTFRVKN